MQKQNRERYYQTLSDERLIANDCLVNSFRIDLPNDVEIQVHYTIGDTESKQLANDVIEIIAGAIPL